MSQATIQSLRSDHIELDLLFDLYEGAIHYSQRQAIVRRLCTELEAQAIAQEELFYPAVQQNMGQEGMAFVAEGRRRQQAIKFFLRPLRGGRLNPREFAVVVAELKHRVRQHIHAEQELFPALRTQLGSVSERLGRQMHQRKRQLMALANRPEVESLTQVLESRSPEI